MNAGDLESLLEWLGPAGAKAGLQGSKLKIAELRKLADELSMSVKEGASRDDVIVSIVDCAIEKVTLERKILIETVVQLSESALIDFLNQETLTDYQIKELLNELGLKVPKGGRKKIVEFAVREITEIGMYRRIASGRTTPASEGVIVTSSKKIAESTQ